MTTMKQTRHMSRWLIGFFICLSMLLSGCQVGGTEAPTTPLVEATATPIAPPAASASPEISIPTEPAGAPTLSPAAPPPPLLYIHRGTLMEQVGSGAPQRLMDLPDAGTVLDARRIDDVVLVLRSQGLQRVRLADGLSDLLLRFDLPARFGAIMLMDGTRAVYQATVDDSQAEFSFGTRIGLYQADSDTIRAVLAVAQNMHVLGLTADGSGLYLLPRGQDPAFGRVLVVALESGEIEMELPIECAIFAMPSPNDRYLVTTAQRSVSDDGEVEGVLNLYDLASRPLTPRQVVLPNPPSSPVALGWSSDSCSLYFVLHPGNPWDELVGSYGLWRLEVESGTLSQIAAAKPDREPFITFSPDGQWVLLRHSSEDVATRMHLSTGAIEAFTLPAVAVETSTVRGWEARSTLSPDGQWLLLRHVSRHMATLVHLPSGASESFALPGEAVVVGWR